MSDCYCDYDDYDRPTFFRRSIRAARKSHKCTECGGVITAGERYEHVAGKWPDSRSVDELKTCERCYDIRQWVQNSVPCFCWAYGSMIDDAKEAVQEAWWRAPAETVGLRFGLLRRIAKRDRLNRERRPPKFVRLGLPVAASNGANDG